MTLPSANPQRRGLLGLGVIPTVTIAVLDTVAGLSCIAAAAFYPRAE
jgi:hypothetical protein